MSRSIKRNMAALLTSSVLFTSMYAVNAHAELSIGALGGVESFTTQVRGNAIYNYGGTNGYYAYPMDININQLTAGFLARYLYDTPKGFFVGAETGYMFMNVNQTRPRSNIVITNTIQPWVESFSTKSVGLGLLNLVVGLHLAPNVRFNAFIGPAWLSTNYVANDFANQVSIGINNEYQRTYDVGSEVDWQFGKNWSAGMRYDYLGRTSVRTVSTIGSTGTQLLQPLTAQTYVDIFSFNIRYLIPNT